MDNIWIAVITALVSPALLALIQQWFRRQEKQQDWVRQDQVAKLAAHSSELLLEQQALINTKASEAALQLQRNNIAVAVTAAETQGQLRQIHSLVNGTMTAAMLKELEQREVALALMLELVAFKESVGKETPIGITSSITQMTAAITLLRAEIAARVRRETDADIAAHELETKIEKIKRTEEGIV